MSRRRVRIVISLDVDVDLWTEQYAGGPLTVAELRRDLRGYVAEQVAFSNAAEEGVLHNVVVAP